MPRYEIGTLTWLKSNAPLTVEHLRILRRAVNDPAERLDLLTQYYRDTPEGRAELRDSPHAHTPPEEVAEKLCREIDTWEDDGYPASYPEEGKKL